MRSNMYLVKMSGEERMTKEVQGIVRENFPELIQNSDSRKTIIPPKFLLKRNLLIDTE